MVLYDTIYFIVYKIRSLSFPVLLAMKSALVQCKECQELQLVSSVRLRLQKMTSVSIAHFCNVCAGLIYNTAVLKSLPSQSHSSPELNSLVSEQWPVGVKLFATTQGKLKEVNLSGFLTNSYLNRQKSI